MSDGLVEHDETFSIASDVVARLVAEYLTRQGYTMPKYNRTFVSASWSEGNGVVRVSYITNATDGEES